LIILQAMEEMGAMVVMALEAAAVVVAASACLMM
jgi:hypothetical protein